MSTPSSGLLPGIVILNNQCIDMVERKKQRGTSNWYTFFVTHDESSKDDTHYFWHYESHFVALSAHATNGDILTIEYDSNIAKGKYPETPDILHLKTMDYYGFISLKKLVEIINTDKMDPKMRIAVKYDTK